MLFRTSEYLEKARDRGCPRRQHRSLLAQAIRQAVRPIVRGSTAARRGVGVGAKTVERGLNQLAFRRGSRPRLHARESAVILWGGVATLIEAGLRKYNERRAAMPTTTERHNKPKRRKPVAAATVVAVTARSAICPAPPPPPPAATEQNTPQEAETMLSTRTKNPRASNPGTSSKRRTPKRKPMYLVILSWIELLLSALNSSAKISSNRDETKSTVPRPVSSQQPAASRRHTSIVVIDRSTSINVDSFGKKARTVKPKYVCGVEKMHFGMLVDL